MDTPARIALMIDNETLSLRPNAAVVQVGFCVANLATREYLVQPQSFHLKPRGGHLDPDTIAWWMRQKDEVRNAVFPAEGLFLRPMELFSEFRTLMQRFPLAEVWASPSTFDLPQLTTMWGGLKPWHYTAERDLGTLRRHLDPKGLLKPPPNPLAHEAAADAHWQMEYLMNLVHGA